MSTNDIYQLDTAGGFWKRTENASDLAYSDGEDVENYIHGALKQAADKTVGSEELMRFIKDWPTEYHFSPARHNLLLPFRFDGLEVLEIGSGCGAITRFLAESGARVVALEGSSRRAAITAARCEDVKGVQVYCDNFRKFTLDRRFDVVTAIGVLEYAPSFFEGPDPITSFLVRAGEFLKTGGTLIVAIENQLGLKYFAGCTEDHTGELFYGIEDRYGEARTVMTLGKAELIARLRNAGFSTLRFFYPFPDYKLPRFIFTEEGLTDKELGACRMIGDAPARDYGRSRMSVFSEEFAWDVVGRNNLAPELTNSFLVAACKGRGSHLLSADWLGKCFTSNRRKKYRTVTTFKKRTGDVGRNWIAVTKEFMHPGLSGTSFSLAKLRVPYEARFVPGITLKRQIAQRLLSTRATIAEITSLLAKWIEFLMKNAMPKCNGTGRIHLPGSFIDCVPWNLAVHPRNGNLVYFDREWHYLMPLALEHTLVRGFLYLGLRPTNTQPLARITILDLMQETAARAGISLTSQKVQSVLEAEALFIHETHDLDPADWLARQIAAIGKPPEATPGLQEVTREKERRDLRLDEGRAPGFDELLQGCQQIEQLQNLIQERDAQLAQLQEWLGADESELGRLRERIAALEKEAAGFQAVVRDRDALAEQLQAREAELTQLREWVQRDDQELEVLRDQLGQREAEVARYEGLLRERELLEHQLQAEVGERDKRLEELSGLIQERDAQLAQLQEWLGADESELGRLRERIAALEKEAAGFQAVVRDRDALAEQAQAKIERLKRTLQEKEALLNSIYQSTSWKVTAPARQIGSLFRRTH
jgi:2-polyprenyl-3-methyl-5-hydroxy-6-metoxy-1,4-benzoquinol methylase